VEASRESVPAAGSLFLLRCIDRGHSEQVYEDIVNTFEHDDGLLKGTSICPGHREMS
jgi:hypothetical protein